jgi:4-aminobutyrate aminotransferase-like enzyme
VAAPLAANGGFMFFTFTGGDAMCAGADKVLEILETEGLVARSAQMGEVLMGKLDAALGAHPHVLEIRGKGLFVGLELVADRPTGEPFPASAKVAAAVSAACLARDVWIYPAGSGPVQDAVMIGCPLTVSEAELDQLVSVLAASIDEVTRAL